MIKCRFARTGPAMGNNKFLALLAEGIGNRAGVPACLRKIPSSHRRNFFRPSLLVCLRGLQRGEKRDQQSLSRRHIAKAGSTPAATDQTGEEGCPACEGRAPCKVRPGGNSGPTLNRSAAFRKGTILLRPDLSFVSLIRSWRRCGPATGMPSSVVGRICLSTADTGGTRNQPYKGALDRRLGNPPRVGHQVEARKYTERD